MKVKELIRLLQKQDPDDDLVITGSWEENKTVPGSVVCLHAESGPLVIHDIGKRRVELFSSLQRTVAVEIMPADNYEVQIDQFTYEKVSDER